MTIGKGKRPRMLQWEYEEKLHPLYQEADP
jgi:hypothetical protein